VDTDSPIDGDLVCMKCGYNLRKRRPSESCPECNHPIAPSIRWNQISNVITSYRAFTAGAWLLIISMCMGSVDLVTGIIVYAIGREDLPKIEIAVAVATAGEAAHFAAAATLLGGGIFISRSLGRRVLSGITGGAVRAAFIASAIVLLLYYAASFLAWANLEAGILSFERILMIVHYLSMAFAWIYPITMVLLFGATIFAMVSLCRQMKLKAHERGAWLIFGGILLLLPVNTVLWQLTLREVIATSSMIHRWLMMPLGYAVQGSSLIIAAYLFTLWQAVGTTLKAGKLRQSAAAPAAS
jgi:hypothetical protein